jgi:hypothetical protein
LTQGGEGQVTGQELLNYLQQEFGHWHDYLAGKISRAALKRRVHRDVFSGMWKTVNDGREASHQPTRALCRDLHKRWQQLWRFLDYAGVEPTNNRAEEVLRPAVIWRKLSFRTQTAAGSRFVETMLSIIETCRPQGRKILDVITASVEPDTTPPIRFRSSTGCGGRHYLHNGLHEVRRISQKLHENWRIILRIAGVRVKNRSIENYNLNNGKSLRLTSPYYESVTSIDASIDAASPSGSLLSLLFSLVIQERELKFEMRETKIINIRIFAEVVQR